MSTATIDKIADIAANTASKYPCIRRIGLFGSYARGDYADGSDIDLLYDYDYNMSDATQQFLSFVEDFCDNVKPLEVDFVFYENLLSSEDRRFCDRVLNDAVWIYKA